MDRYEHMPSDLTQLADLIAKGGLMPFLLFILLVLGREYRRQERRCERWQQLALNALNDADKGTSLADFFRELKA